MVQCATAQTHPQLECVVVDDGSTDESRSIIQGLAGADPRVRLVGQSNQGVSAARNRGFQAAKGEFIQFLDGDDTIEPNKLELQLAHFEAAPDLGVSYTDHQFLDVASGKLASYEFEPLEEYPLEQMLFRWFDGATSRN